MGLSKLVLGITIVWFSTSAGSGSVDAYIIAPGAVPPPRQMKWLKQMTVDICQSKVGELSNDQVSQTRDLMYELSHNPKLQNLCQDDECAVAIESLLKRVVAEQRASASERTAAKNIVITTQDYNCVLEGWARCPSASIVTAERCEQILDAMIQHGPYPDRDSFKACLTAWKQTISTKQDDHKHSQQQHVQHVAPYRAQRLLELMIRSYDSECPYRSKLLPDADCFDMVLQTWSRSNDPKAAARTETIVGLMDKLHRATGFPELRPRRNSLNAVMSSWVRVKSDEAPYRIASILDFMDFRANELEDFAVAPDVASYNIVLNSFAHQTNPDQSLWAANKAMSYIDKIVESYKIPHTDANGIAPKVVPDKILFNTAITLWGKAKYYHPRTERSLKAYRKARVILDKQIDLYQNYGCRSCKPDIFGFTSVIGCCASVTDPKEQPKAFKAALETFGLLQTLAEKDRLKYVKKNGKEPSAKNTDLLRPNHVTYGAMLKTCAKLLPPSSEIRHRMVEDIFNECKANGQVSELVLSWLRDAASPQSFKELLEGHSKKELPEMWSENVIERNQNNGNDVRRKSKHQTKKTKKPRRAEV